jgi:hypothetical protein
MNAAPAELLHFLVNAALQPICPPTQGRSEQKKRRHASRRRNHFAERPTFFEEYAAVSEKFRLIGAVKKV